MSETPEQGEFDLGIEPSPKRLEGEALEAERKRIADGVRQAAEARESEQDEGGEALSLQDRLDRITQPVREADADINEGVSAARKDQTSEVLIDHELNADIQDAQDRAEEAARERRRAARQQVRDAQAVAQREINQEGRRDVARHWTPPETAGQQAVREAMERGEVARAARAKRVDTPDEAREAAERLRAENAEREEGEQG